MERAMMKMIGPFARQIRTLAGRAVIRLVNDALKEQGVQIDLLAEETREAERYQHYGFTSVPHPGAEAITLSIGGSRDHVVVVADGDRRYRLKGLADGEVAIYDDLGQAVHLKRSGIEVYGTEKVTVTAPETEFTGNVLIGGNATVEGNITVTGNVTTSGTMAASGAVSSGVSVADPTGTMQDMRGTYNSHKHGSSVTPTPTM